MPELPLYDVEQRIQRFRTYYMKPANPSPHYTPCKGAEDTPFTEELRNTLMRCSPL